jgi:hypothetical protein
VQEQAIERVRSHAGRKGLNLVQIDRGPADDGGLPLYQLTVAGGDGRVFPQGAGVEGVPLHEVEDWLSYPWE